MLFFGKKPKKEFPDWEDLYKEKDVKEMPWYSEELDSDFEKEIEKRKIQKSTVLDIGSGPGTQAIEMARKGLTVIASDISRTAVEKAQKLALKKSAKVEFVFDDILHSSLLPKHFDFAFDRGCFHVLMPEQRLHYVDILYNLLKDNGLLFLKVFSEKQKGNDGPYRFSEKQLREVFGKKFEVLSINESEFNGLTEKPKAFFCVLKKRLH